MLGSYPTRHARCASAAARDARGAVASAVSAVSATTAGLATVTAVAAAPPSEDGTGAWWLADGTSAWWLADGTATWRGTSRVGMRGLGSKLDAPMPRWVRVNGLPRSASRKSAMHASKSDRMSAEPPPSHGKCGIGLERLVAQPTTPPCGLFMVREPQRRNRTVSVRGRRA